MLRAEQASLLAAITAVQTAVEKRETIPILQNILIQRDGDGLIARGTNMDVEVSGRFKAELADNYLDFTCPGETFVKFVTNAPHPEISIEPVMTGDSLVAVTLLSGRAKLRIPALPAADFPSMGAVEGGYTLTVAGSLLRKAFEGVRYAVGKDINRRWIEGVFIRGDAEGIEMVAADGKRIERSLIQAVAFDDDVDLKSMPPSIIDGPIVDRIMQLAKGEQDVRLDIAYEKISITVGGVVMTAKLIEGEYPDWRKYWPKDNDFHALMQAAQFSDAIERVMLATPDRGHGVSLKFADGLLTLRARDMSSGEGWDQIAAECDGEREYGINGAHVVQALKHMDGDGAEMVIGEARAFAILREAGSEHNFTLLSAMQVKGW
jgi:DNA polymerase-3 subunit beta